MGEQFRTDRTRYPTHRAHVKSARDRVRRVAFEWDLEESVITDLALIASELFTNAVLHAHPARGREIGVTLVLSPGCVRLEVRDAGNALPTAREPSDDDPTGRGLLLVGTLADRWDVITQVVGKTVFAEIDLQKSTTRYGMGVGRA
ncbi:serine/threonine-protein kinase RsbW [Streptomyces canus]|uniref:Serine/threonine-protein kinase RsbW n=1 Tax=Streptomyces canus TaxID=58343 RepID=A0AAW8FF32_9ACTN|nr:ATP-binding protein [Streptomyces canus]MDQ0907775.1 serine/threonine-protein kinase RsbW [Streptomyces canus]